MPASSESLGQLHVALSRAFGDILENGVTTTDDEGKAVKVTPSPAYLNTIRQFLKDNGIEAIRTPGSPLDNLVNQLPFACAEDEEVPAKV